jgi:hypothetical protein
VGAVCSGACSAAQLSADEVQLHINPPRFWETAEKQDTVVEVLAVGPVAMANALAGMLTAEGTLPLPEPYSTPSFHGAAMLTVGLNTGARPTLCNDTPKGDASMPRFRPIDPVTLHTSPSR